MTFSDPAPSLYDTYNAKWLSPSEVAETFVAPPQFIKLAKRRNSLLVGPRGSGKTTLLKMLTQSANERWATRGVSRRLDYTGVFVATDISWNLQLNYLGEGRLNVRTLNLLQMAALTAQTHIALVDAMELRSKRLKERYANSTVSNHREVQVVTALASLWKLAPTIPSYYSARSALRQRLQNIYEIAIKENELGAEGPSERLFKNEFLTLPLLVSCRGVVEHFNEVYREKQRYWAFLFDEVELMPVTLREELYRYLRTFPGQMLLKLAWSPFDDQLVPNDGTQSPQRDDDYDFIPLWYPRKRKGYGFCRSLWRGMVRDGPLVDKAVEEVLGRSLLDTEIEDWEALGTAYTKDSSHYRYLKQLSDSDRSFKKYLNQHKIDLDRIEQIRGTDRASTLRKIFPLVVARVEHVRFTDQETSELRGRKVSSIYTGATSIFDISEGNPRKFIGLTSRLIERLSEQYLSVNKDIQADEITQTVTRFRALLRTIVVPNIPPKVFTRGILSLLDPIGKRLQHLSLVAPFSPEPPGTFVVDSAVGDDVVRLLGYALNAGAIMHVPDREGEEELLSSGRIREKKFRLSYLLAAHYGIPPRLGRQISLTKLLQGSVKKDEAHTLFVGGAE